MIRGSHAPVIFSYLLSLFILLFAVTPQAGFAATYYVRTTADQNDGGDCTNSSNTDCSLRDAVAAATASGGDDIVDLPAGNYVLSLGQITSNNGKLTINGGGSGTTVIDGNNASRIFDTGWTTAGMEFNDVTLTQGNAGAAADGGCVIMRNQPIIVTNSVFSNCTARRGGAIFSDQPITVTISGSTFSGNAANNTGTNTGGGAVEAKGITVTNSTFTSNTATGASARGGALYSPTTLSITGSTFTSNQITTSGHGGAVFALSNISINTSTFTTNSTASGQGGAAYMNGGTASITDSYFKSNSSTGDGGAVSSIVDITVDGSTFETNNSSAGLGGALTRYGNVTVTNSTFSGNTSNSGGGAIRGGTTTTIKYSTFYNNSTNAANGGGAVLADTLTTVGSIYTANTSNAVGDHCGWSAKTSTGYNVDHNGYCGFTPTTGDVTTDPLLQALADNGGPTKTHAVTSGPAVDGGPASCTAATGDVDQRNETRPQGSNCDIGAYEHISAAAPTNTFTSGTYDSSTNTLVFTGTNFDTIDAVSTDVKTYMDWTKFSWDVNGDNATTANISVAEADVTSLIITNATTLTLVFTTAKASAIEATAGVGIDGGVDTLDITAGFSKTSGGTPATTDGLADGTFTIDSNQFNVTKIADTADGNCTLADCSLREAISAANADASATPGSPHIINIPADASPYAITLTGLDSTNAAGDFDVKEDIKFVGAGAASTTISGQTGGGDWVFQLFTGYTITFEGMTITNNGNDSGQTTGGCIYSDSNLTVKDSTFNTCKAGRGGAILVSSGYTLTIDNSTFTSNTTTDKGGAVLAYGITIQNGATFQNNYATNYGGAIYNGTQDITINGTTLFDNNDTSKGTGDRGGAIYTQGNLTLNDTSGATTFQNNDAYCGGAINVDSSTKILTATGTIFTSNTTNNHGGALCVYGGNLTDVTFTNNSTTNYGGAIYSLTNDLTINGTNSFTNNDTAKLSSDNGGAIYATGNVSINVTSGSTTFENNDAYCGGAINVNASAKLLTAKNSTFTTNTAANIGGALCINGGTLTDVSFTSNNATNQGGAIYSINNALTINGTSNTFASNSSTSDVGGAISSPSGAVDVTNTTFNLNTAAGNGGAISANNGSSCCTVTATDSTFTNNQATAGNGGAINTRSSITLTDTTLDNNTASGSGGSAFTSAGAATLTRVTISNNTATTGDGGGIWTSQGVNAYNSTISGNAANGGASLGGGVYTDGTGGTCSYTNTTFYNNSANSNGSSLRGGEACTMKNVLMTSNGTAKNCRYNTHTVTTSKEYHSTQAASCNFGALDAGLNVDTLKDNGGKTKTHALFTGSSAIDNGDLTTCTNAPISNLDQRGVTRDTGDSKCDIGAYEGSVAPAGPSNTFTSGTYDSSTNTLVFTGTNFDTIDVVSTDVKTYMDWTKFSWDINGDNGTTTDISVAEADVSSLIITNATTLTLVFTTTKANSIEATAGVGIDGNADTLDITAGFSRDSGANPATTDGLSDGTFTIDSNEFNVTKTADTADGNCTLADCSLREAITGANNVTGADTVNVPDNTYTLTGASGEDSNASGDYDITGDVTIAGTSLANTIVDANSLDRVFDIKTGANVTLSNMTVKRGLIAANGGCVLTSNTLITLNTVKFDTCKGTYGGAVYAAAGFHITASQFASNWATATGGGIYNTSAAGDFYGANTFTGNHADGAATNAGGAFLSNAQIVTIHDAGSSFTGNYGGGSGGAVWVSAALNISAATTFDGNYSTADAGGAVISKGGTITETTFKNNYGYHTGGALFFVTNSGSVSNSTFEGNYVNAGTNQYGGAFYSNTGGNTFTNVTFSGNSAVNGGAIYNAGVCTIKNSTFYDNDATSGTGDHVGCVNGTVTNSVFYSTTAPSSSLCYGVPNGTNNYKYNHAGSACGASSTNADPTLSPLADNGGNTKTHAPYVGSPLLDAGDLTTCTNAPVSNLDQIGTTRDSGDSKCDIGAYEGSIALPGVAISGTVYTDEGTTTIADGATVRLVINGVSAGTDTTVSGAYSITASPSAGDAMIVYIDGHASDGTTVTVSDGNALAALDIYADRLILRHDNSASLTNANMTTALGAYSDAEILYTTDGSNNLTVSGSTTELYVPTVHSYTPGANINTTDIEIIGTLTAGSNTITIARNWDDSAGTFVRETSTVDFTGTGSITTTEYSVPFYNLTVGAAGETTTTAQHFTVANVLTVGAGEITGPTVIYLTALNPLSLDSSATISVDYLYLNSGGAQNLLAHTYDCGIKLHSTGTNVTQTGAVTINGHLLVNGNWAGEAKVVTYNTAGFDLTVNGNIEVGYGNDTGLKTFDATNSAVSVSGNFKVLPIGAGSAQAVTNMTGSTITFNGAADQTITSSNSSFNNVTLNNTGTNGSADDIIIADAIDVNGILTITDGDLDISTNDPTVNTAGNVDVAANGSIDVSARTANWTFDGTSILTDSSAGQDFEDVVINGTSLTLGSNAKVQTMTVTAGTLNLGASGYILEIDGTGTPLSNSGTFTAGTSTVKYTGTTTATNITTVAYNNLQLAPTASTTYSLTGHLTGGNALTGNLTIDADATLDTTAGNNYNIGVGGNFVQSSTSSQMLANSSTLTVAGDFNADGTVNSTGYNSASLVLTGTGGLTYANLASSWANGFNNLTVGQSGNTTTINSNLSIGTLLTVGSGEATGASVLNLLGTNDVLSFDAAANVSVTTLSFNVVGASQNLPTLTNGYDCNIRATTQNLTVVQTGNVTINGSNDLLVNGNGFVDRAITYNTAGFDLSVGGDIIIGAGGDTVLKTLNGTNSAISVGGNFTVTAVGGGSTQATFTSTGSTVTLNSSTADQTITSSGSSFNNLTLNNTASSGSDDIIIADALDINAVLTITDGDLDISTNDPTINTAGNVSIGASGSIDVSSRTANWTFDGTSSLTDSSAGQDFEGVVVNGTSLTLGSNAKVQTMTITSGTLDLGSSGYVLEIDGTGTPLSNSGTFTVGTSTVKYTGTTTATNIATLPYSSLQLTPGGATTYSLMGHQTGGNAITGNITIDTSAILTTTGSNYNIALAGDWSNSGAFTAGTGTVTLNGTGQAINGSTTFYDLTKSVAAADTLTFEATKTTTIASGGTVTLNGASGQLLMLASSTGSSAWNFVLTDATVTKAIDYVSVSWSDASGSHATQKPIEPTNSTDGGNNTDWFAAAAPVITVAKMSVVISDPVNGGSNPKRIPGAVVEYSVIPSNSGDASPDANSVYITDPIDTTMVEFYATGGVSFTDGATSSGLALGTVSYSSTAAPGPYVYDYTPVPDGDGYDSNITSVKITTTGTFAFGGAPDPSFTLKFRVRVQ